MDGDGLGRCGARHERADCSAALSAGRAGDEDCGGRHDCARVWQAKTGPSTLDNAYSFELAASGGRAPYSLRVRYDL